jgi:hypothetical protein
VGLSDLHDDEVVELRLYRLISSSSHHEADRADLERISTFAILGVRVRAVAASVTVQSVPIG